MIIGDKWRGHVEISPQKRIQIVFQGLWDVGVSAILTRLAEGKFEADAWVTNWSDFRKVTVEGIALIAWNFHRRERGRPSYERHYRRTEGVVCVIDSNDRQNLDHALLEMEIFFKEENPRAKVMMVLANKQDLEGALSVEEIEKCVMERVSAHGPTMEGKTVFVRGCSAKTGEGLTEAFSFFLEEIQKRQVEEPKPTDVSVKDDVKNKESRFHFLKQLYKNSFVKSVLFH